MAKCSICKQVKGKRQCLAFEGVVCSSCCGSSRSEATCSGCSFFRPSPMIRRYESTQHFSIQQMANSPQLEEASNVIEGAMCGFDLSKDQTLQDEFCKKVMERLLDRYAFGDQTLSFSDDLEQEGYVFIESAIHRDIPGVDTDFLGKLLSTVYRSIKRHANSIFQGRHYLDFIHSHVGAGIAPGVRALNHPGLLDDLS